MTKPFFLFVFCACAGLFSCIEDKVAFALSDFQMPDSILPAKHIAIFEEETGSGVSVLAFGNNRHLGPRRITYFTTGQVMSEALKALPDGRFEALDGSAEYTLQKDIVEVNYHQLPPCGNWVGINYTPGQEEN